MGINKWKRIKAIVKPGHKVASGQAIDSPYPQGTITMQIPHFQAQGLDLETFYPATLNISISPYTFRLINPSYTFKQITWTTNHPPETFSFSPCHLIYQTKIYVAWIYYPHPETKTRHFQKPSTLEIIAPFIPDLNDEAFLEIEVNTEEVALVHKPKYSIPEIERRWLAIETNLPDLSSLTPWEITDRYITGTRLRLRRMAKIDKTDSKNDVIYKLCKKYGKTSPISEPIVNIYLSAAEYNTLAQLPARQTKKLRYDVDYFGVHFMVNFYSDDGPITVETEFENEIQAANCQIPPFCGQEVSNDASFEGIAMATNPGGP